MAAYNGTNGGGGTSNTSNKPSNPFVTEANLFKAMERRVLRWIVIVVFTNIVSIVGAVAYITDIKHRTVTNEEAIHEIKRQNDAITGFTDRVARTETLLQAMATQNARIEDRLDSVIDRLSSR